MESIKSESVPTVQTEGTAEARYQRLEHRRHHFLRRARASARLTIPSLLPEEGHTSSSELPTTYQSIGSRGVNNLSSKLVLTIIPPNSPFFKAQPSFMDLEELRKMGGEGEKMATEYQVALGKYERTVQEETEVSGDRTVIFEIFDHLVTTGNALMADTADGLKMYPLSHYVCRRDPAGNTMEIIAKETVDPSLLPEEIQLTVKTNNDLDKTVDLYTHVKREGKKWIVYQEAGGVRVPGSDGSYPLDAPAFVALRFRHISGEDYGRGYVEEFIGDLISLEGLRKAVVEGAAAAAKLLFLVDPNGTTREKTIADAPSGAIRQGRRDDVTVLQMDKHHDFSTAKEVAYEIQRDLEMAFLLNTSIQRDAERVTAEEIRFMAAELESALGGLYAILAKEFQRPYLMRKINKMEKAGRLPVLPKKDVKFTIITGFEALGRGQDLNKLDLFLAGTAQTLGPQVVAQYIKPGNYMKRRALALGMDVEGLIKNDDEIAQEQQQMQQQQMMSQFGPEVIKQVGQGISKQGNIPNGG